MLSTFDALKGIAEDWDNMSLAEQQAIGIALAGKNQFEVFAATVENFDQAIKASETALMSWGSAAAENAKYMDSIQGRVSDFKSAFESLSLSLISSDFIKGVVSAGTAILKFANTDLGQATIKIMAFIGVMKLLKAVSLTKAFTGSFGNLKKIITPTIAAMTGLRESMRQTAMAMNFSTAANRAASSFRIVGAGARTLGASLLEVIGPANLVIAALTILGGIAYKTISDAFHENDRVIDEQKTKVAELETGLESLRSEYEALAESDSLNAQDQQRLKYLEAQIKANEVLLQQEAKKQYKAQFETADVVQTGYGRGKVDYGGPIYGDTGAEKLKKYAEESLEVQAKLRDTQKEIANLDTTASDFNERMAELTKTEEEQKKTLADLQEEYGGTAKEYYDLLQKMDPSEITEAQQGLVDSLLEVNEGFFELMGSAGGAAAQATAAGQAFLEVEGYIQGASEALNAYNEALEAGSSDQYFQGYAGAWKTLNEEIEKGTVNSREALEAAKLIFGQDALRKAGYDVQTLVNNAKYLPTIFGDSESSGAGLVKVLDLIKNSSGEIVDSTGEVIGHLTKLSDGTINLDIPNENFGKLAETLGMDEDALISVFEALTQIGAFSLVDIDGIIGDLEELGKVAEVSGKKAISLDEYNRQTKNFGNDITKFAQFDQQLRQAGVTVIDFGGDLEETLTTLKDFGVATQDASGVFEIDYEQLKEFMKQLGYTEQEIDNFASKLQGVNNINLSNINGQIEATRTNLGNLEKFTPTNLFTMMSKVGEAALKQVKPTNKVEDAVGDLNKAKTTAVTGQIDNIKSAADNATSAVKKITDAITGIPSSKNVNITVNGKSAGRGGGAIAGGLSGLGAVINSAYNALKGAAAKGTPSHSGGPVLVGEEYAPDGKPRPEIAIYKGEAQVIGATGPEIVDLPRGTQILPYDVFKKFKDGNKVFSGTIPAFAQGTFSLDTINKLTGGGTTTNAAKKVSSTSSKRTSGKTANASSSASKAIQEENEAIKKQNELFQEEIEILEHQLFLRQKNGASALEQEEIITQIQRRLNEQANWYRSQGLEETHEYIRNLQKSYWSFSDDLVDLWEETLDKMKEEVDDQVDINNDYADLLKRQERNTAVERIAVYRDSQAKIHALAEQYRAMGLDENSELIRELKKQWWELEDEIQDIYDEVADIIQSRADDTETAINWLLKQVNRQIDVWKKEQEEIDKEREEKKKALQEANEELEKQIELQNALNSLAQAQNRKNLIYKDGFFQYLGDVDAVSEAAKNLDEINKKQQLEQAIKDLDNWRKDEYDILQKNIDDYQKYLDEYEDFVDKYQEEQDRMIAEQVFGVKLEGDNWKNRLDNLKDYVQQYNELMDSLNTGSYKDDIAGAIYPDSKTVAVMQGGSAPKGLNVGDKVVTGVGTYLITGVDKNTGNYSSVMYDESWKLPEWVPKSEQGNNVIVDKNGNWYYENKGPGSAIGKPSTGGDTGNNETPSTPKLEGGYGKTVTAVQGGSAPKGLAVGTKVATAGGTWMITGINPNGTYQSRLVDERAYPGPWSTNYSKMWIEGYANGTKSAIGGLSIVGENGPELRVLNSGDGIIPAKLTDNLMAWGTLNPSAFFSIADKNKGTTQTVNIETVNLPNVSDAEQFVHELKNFTTRAIQYGSA